MKIFAPKYVKSFKCIAQNCRHSCCIGWEIDVDNDTLKRYQSMKDKSILNTVDVGNESELCHFRLNPDGRCMNLSDVGLCKIICKYGEDFIPEICREHPRFYNRTRRGLEMGIGMSCEAACRIILSTDDYGITEYEKSETHDLPLPEFDAPSQIEEIYGILSQSDEPYSKRLEKVFSLYNIPKSILEDENRWQSAFGSLEYLNESHRDAFTKYRYDNKTDKENERLLERALAYYILRHASTADSTQDFRARITLAFLFERLYATLLSSKTAEDSEASFEIARVISEELEYSEDNIESLLFEIDFLL